MPDSGVQDVAKKWFVSLTVDRNRRSPRTLTPCSSPHDGNLCRARGGESCRLVVAAWREPTGGCAVVPWFTTRGSFGSALRRERTTRPVRAVWRVRCTRFPLVCETGANSAGMQIWRLKF